MQSILLIEDREGLRQVYATFLRGQDYGVHETGSVDEARKALKHHQFSLILSDYMLPGTNGLDFLKELRGQDKDTPVIMMTAFGEVKLAVEVMKSGAFDFLEKPIDLEHLKLVVARALEHNSLKRRSEYDRDRDRQSDHVIIGNSAALQKVVTLADKVAPVDTTCLLLGESGVGKEVFARYLHAGSPRAEGPLVAVNCASIPGELLESELFGHERGAFTGADRRKIGLVEMADAGTLFLDEIGELPLDLQPKLLRFIQTREMTRVGGTRVIKSDARLLCATNRDLKAGYREGWFREDLYYRLAVFPLEVPPLRVRIEDLDELVPFFMNRAGHPHPNLDPNLLARLKAYSWPGNVRELENVLERACILSRQEPLAERHFPIDLFTTSDSLPVNMTMDLNKTLKGNMKDWEQALERHLIAALLREEGGRRDRVAARLGVSVKTLYNKMQAHQLSGD
ncbi:MAG: sigma-54 dependent transcriptional regulator [Acidobacteriota bacterium]|nr:sigma-54 dependent transcriptional regulator [Acidobacteriota bacterium]